MENIKLEIPDTYQDLYVVGDIHGEFDTLVFNITQRYKIRDSVIIIAGDVGLGFEKPKHYENIYNRLLERLTENNIMLLLVRGNHDDPSFYNGSLKIDYERMKSISDYTFISMKEKDILCIGGAISTDKQWRIEANKEEEDNNSTKRYWWKDEGPTVLEEQDINHLPGRIYAVVSHDAPVSFLPVFKRDQWISTDELFYDILHSREYLEKILWRCKPRRWYYGHHHQSYSGTNGISQYRCLDIQELIRVPLEEDDLPEEEEEEKKEE